jgi:hypothetical protein
MGPIIDKRARAAQSDRDAMTGAVMSGNEAGSATVVGALPAWSDSLASRVLLTDGL